MATLSTIPMTPTETTVQNSGAMASVVDNGPLLLSEKDDRLYRHITLENEMQVTKLAELLFFVLERNFWSSWRY